MQRSKATAFGEVPDGSARVNRARPGGLFVLVLVTLVVAGPGCGRGPGADTLETARRDGVIRIGYAIEAPYAFLDAQGRVTGEGPEVARVIARRLGIARVEWRLAEFGLLLPGLESGLFDVIAAGMFITPERERRVEFSTPTFRVRSALLVRKGNPRGLHSYADIRRSGPLRVAVLTGSVEEEHLTGGGQSGTGTRLVRVPDARSGRALVVAGEVDALALSAPTIRWMTLAPGGGDIETAEPFVEEGAGGGPRLDRGGFAFRKADRALIRAWNEELDRFAGSDEHRQLVLPLGFLAAELPERRAAGPP